MNPCRHIEEYHDGELRGPEREAFEAHLRECETCLLASRRWSLIERSIRELSEEAVREAPTVNDLSEKRIAVGFSNRVRKRTFRARLIGSAAAAAVLLAATTVFFLLKEDGRNTTSRPSVARTGAFRTTIFEGATTSEKRFLPHDEIAIPTGDRAVLRLGDDKVGVRGGSAVVVRTASKEKTRIELRRGVLVAEVAPRRGAGEFIVEAGQDRVRVTGTRFLVERGPDRVLKVAVARGSVEVSRPGEAPVVIRGGSTFTRLDDGTNGESAATDAELSEMETLVDVGSGSRRSVAENPNATISESPKPQAKKVARNSRASDLELWESWIIGGRRTEARAALAAHVREEPSDTRAWFLLGECERRDGRWNRALDAYGQVITRSGDREAGIARFRSGVLLQEKLGRHADAIGMFRAFTSNCGAHPLKSEAMLRTARSELALGRTDDAVALLQSIVREYPGSASAIEARRLLRSEK
jgi:TolA-binding protein